MNSDQGRGEFVIIIAGVDGKKNDGPELTAMLRVLLKSLTVKQSVQIATELTGGSRNQIYDLAVTLRADG